MCEDRSGCRGSERETVDAGAELTTRAELTAITPDPLSRKSSEGLRWISKLEDKETALEGPTKDERDNPTARGSEKELESEDAGLRGSEKQSVQRDDRGPESNESTGSDDRAFENESVHDEDNHLEPAVAVSAGPEESLTLRRRSLPSAPPSPVSRQCFAVICVSACALFLLSIVAIILVYSRWTATPALNATRTTDDSRRQQLGGTGDDSGCDSLFSFSQCADSDMFG